MRALVIEDETELRRQLVTALEEAGFVTESAAIGREAIYQGTEFPIDVAILDLGLPDMDGLEVLGQWRASGATFPVLILTARGRWHEKVAGLETGADDYLVKPFHMEEVIARVRALVRRAGGWASTLLAAGNVEVDTSQQRVNVDGNPVELTAYEYRLLEYLMLHAGEVLSKSNLTGHLYPDDADPDSNVLEVLVGRLRRKLDPEGSTRPIETLRGRGYRLRLARNSD